MLMVVVQEKQSSGRMQVRYVYNMIQRHANMSYMRGQHAKYETTAFKPVLRYIRPKTRYCELTASQ